ncbi:MAG: amidophosphoribosyltransferase [Candidatus Komeilibacteria bacterium RIFCSPLOWO2_01_FULL_45_10]|uniref:Amidophosphoribosyltransferase n=1 Tax=Candidatus Komeilibacteria bacterium RIFCSPLOWO2_01_FULL_45_10 TaxID=1798550 RepID=A0A1G2BKD1_9BACT|nr:MAG: amidophosphoribosyltransferase [Candidatus Komeilibacteria bacterium RIFCSPLOWO2_01_FULL_45_10]
MCGITGIISNNEVSTELYESLLALQHRGQDCAGICTYSDRFHLKKGMGLVREVFHQEDIFNLKGAMGIGQVRYPTVGGGTPEEVQPFMTSSPYGIAMAHNGNVFNFWELKQELFEKDFRQINSNNDVEVILNVFAYELSRFCHREFFDSLVQAVKAVHQRVKGAYSVVGLIADKGLIAFRDPHGIRPLVWGQRKTSFKTEHLIASENGMFEILGFDFYRDVEPGELVFIDLKGEVHTYRVTVKEFRPCIFEYVYFARPDAFLNGVSVYRSRLRMGQNLARKIKRDYKKLKIDVVIPAPESATTAALSCAYELGVRYSQSLVKNHFIGRTFIMPGQETRQKANQYKLSAIGFDIKGNNVLVVDDSIVRGNVSRHIIKLMRDNGAKNVYFASASSVLKWPDLYGIDLPTRDEYAAYNRSEEEIRQFIGADVLIYQDLKDLIEAVTRKGDLKFTRPHCAYFDGDYPTGDVTEAVLEEVERQRKGERGNINPQNSQGARMI